MHPYIAGEEALLRARQAAQVRPRHRVPQTHRVRDVLGWTLVRLGLALLRHPPQPRRARQPA